MEYVRSTLGSLLIQLPLYITWLVGIVLALVWWKRHPRVSLLAVIGLTAMLILTVLTSIANLWLPFWIENFGTGRMGISVIFLIMNILEGILMAGIWIVVLAAIFNGRKTKPQAAATHTAGEEPAGLG
jgi:hypothetical protein